MSIEPVRISYQILRSSPHTAAEDIQQAFGSDEGCLGIILVDDLPEQFTALREKLFRLAQVFATASEDVRESLVRPETSYSFGWSHGKEVMNGRPDTQKGSYYANPMLDVPNVSDAQRQAHPEYYAGNVWPRDVPGLEDFEKTFKALGALIFEVGCALATACESFVASNVASGSKSTVQSLIANSKTNKARLLHYFPETASSSSSSSTTSSDSPSDGQRIANDALCGTHVDHSLLTGLCSAMYLSTETGSPQIVSAPTPTAGLWIYPRHRTGTPRPDPVKVAIPQHCLAFQTGEALEILTSHRLAATPHFVSGSSGGSPQAQYISRETFAFFLQPDVDDVIGPDGETFGAFTKRVLGRHYQDQAFKEAED
ncbi:Clavaminate synthase-like protein [Kockovaella imperatae]|uniref:Clavaminate synthase-like protein n=1 Tax=Kockovaella imperatae TaxID=4999 RepID=A0A1Y1UQS8_9TREE|nr:Clavaminate synthase-like protein [Kockovaella imperatae]ORX39824.1 Clavaminate synthase-like protein [Kockovaella imperatae]